MKQTKQFRAWDEVNKKMLQPYDIESDCKALGMWLDDYRNLMEGFRIKFGDKHKVVFIDDIIEMLWESDFWGIDRKYKATGIVIFDDERAQYLVEVDNKGEVMHFPFYSVNAEVLCDWTILGNIHEDPEMLEQEGGIKDL